MTTTTQHVIQTSGSIIGRSGVWQIATLATPDGMTEHGRPYGARTWTRLELPPSQRNAVRHACRMHANSQEFSGVLTTPR